MHLADVVQKHRSELVHSVRQLRAVHIRQPLERVVRIWRRPRCSGLQLGDLPCQPGLLALQELRAQVL